MINVLFLCTGNSARSILGEAIVNHVGQGRFHGYSAGSHPVGQVNPYALELLKTKTCDIAELRSKSWDEFADNRSKKIDLVITVCDQAGAEVCPIWPGGPISVHWGLPDPAAVTGDSDQIRAAFSDTYSILEKRLTTLVKSVLDAPSENPLDAALKRVSETHLTAGSFKTPPRSAP